MAFVNGQYVGGDPKYVNLFAAIESFPAETPELKSRQGVFGDPFFLHDQMDINESVALGLIDFILVEKSSMTGDPELSVDVFEDMSKGALSPSSSYWFKSESKKESQSDTPAKTEQQAGAGKGELLQVSAVR